MWGRGVQAVTKRTARWLMVGLVIGLTACDLEILSGPEKVPLRAQLREQGSACELEVYFSNSVRGTPAAEPSYYRLSTGEPATSATPIPGVHGLVVVFPDPVAVADIIQLGAGTPEETTVSVSASEVDAQPATLLGASFTADAESPLVVLTFDDALDPSIAADLTRYSLQNTIEHPVSASVIGCGQEVELVFDVLSATTVIDVEGLCDVNGVGIEDHLGVRVLAAEEEARPQIESAKFPIDGSAAAVEITFNEAVDQTTAETVGHYLLHPDELPPLGVEVAAGGRTVLVSFAAIDPPVSIDVEGVLDLAGNPMDPITDREVLANGDDAPPGLVSVNPTSRDGGVILRVKFTEAVTLTSAEQLANYRLIDPTTSDGQQPTRAVLQSGGTAVDVTFDYVPTDALVEMIDVADLNGNVRTEADRVSVDFSTDATAPQVLEITAVPEATVTSVDVVFDKAVTSSSAENAANYTFSNEAQVESASLQADGRTVRLQTTPISRQTTVAIANVADAAGNVMDSVTGQPIDVGDDAQAPSIDSAVFAADAPDPTVQVVFSEVVDQSSAETARNYARTVDSRSPNSAALQADGRTVLLTFGPMPLETQIRVTGVTDLTGNAVATTTMDIAAGADSTPPYAETVQFLPNQSVPTVEVVFSEAVDQTLAEAPGLYVLGTAAKAADSATLQEDGRTVQVTFPPVSRTDRMEIRSITDLNGNVMTTATQLTVAAAQETNDPVVVSATFSANAATPTVTVEFSEAVDEAATETLSNYRTIAQSTNPTGAVMQSDGHTVVLVFAYLSADDVLLVEDITDFADNSVDGDVQVTISPHSETTAPSVSSATVTGTHEVTIVFSEAVDQASAGNTGNYSGLPVGSSVVSTTLQSDGRTVILVTSGTSLTAGHQIDISGVRDLNSNTMTPVTDLTLS